MFKRCLVTFLMAIFFVNPPVAMAFNDYFDGVNTFEEVLDYTLQYHVDQPPLDQLINGAMDGMLFTLDDPYTEYLTPESLRDFSNALNGDYVGIGVRMLAVEDYAQVMDVFEYSPAAKAGLMAGDLFTAVEGKSIKGLPLGAVTERILGPEGSKVIITIRRGEREFDVALTREAVQVKTVYTEVLTDNIGYIEVNSFGESTAMEFATALEHLRTVGVSGLMIDLRDNNGGYLVAAQRMASQFVPTGKKIVGVVERQQKEISFASLKLAKAPSIPVVILINGQSASAAEIFAGALQDYGLATLVGVQSYGKGTVQSIIDLESGGALKLTTARYVLPSGKHIDGIGLFPDAQVACPNLQEFIARQILQPMEEVTIAYQVDNNLATINGHEFAALGTPYRKTGATYLPLRFTMEALGYHVDWDASRNGIHLKLADNELFVSAAGDTIHPVEVTDGTAYISTTDLVRLGIQCKVENNTLIISK